MFHGVCELVLTISFMSRGAECAQIVFVPCRNGSHSGLNTK